MCFCFRRKRTPSEPAFERTPEFIAECLTGLKQHNIPNMGGLYEKVADGQVLSQKQLITRGYSQWDARNIHFWLTKEHKGMYKDPLAWE